MCGPEEFDMLTDLARHNWNTRARRCTAHALFTVSIVDVGELEHWRSVLIEDVVHGKELADNMGCDEHGDAEATEMVIEGELHPDDESIHVAESPQDMAEYAIGFQYQDWLSSLSVAMDTRGNVRFKETGSYIGRLDFASHKATCNIRGHGRCSCWIRVPSE